MKNEVLVSVNGTLWTVLLVDANNSRLLETSKVLIGKCNSLTNEIIIARNLQPQLMRKIVAHELTHAIIYNNLLNKDEFDQEEVCRFVESYFDLITNKTNEVMNSIYGDING